MEKSLLRLPFQFAIFLGLSLGAHEIAHATESCTPSSAAPMASKYEVKRWNPTLANGQGDWDPDLQYNSCDPENAANKIQQALDFIEAFPAAKNSLAELHSNFLGDSLSQFFNAHIETILFETEEHSSMCRKFGLQAYHQDGEDKILHVCPGIVAFSALTISSYLLHEARHQEGSKYDHTNCESGYYFNLDACDATFDFGGSYAIGAEFKIRASRNEGLSQATRHEARALAMADLVDHFVKPPLGLKQGTVLLSEEGTLSFFDGENLSELATGISPSTIVSIRDLPVFYDAAHATVKDIAFDSNPTDTPGMLARIFREMPESERKDVVDIFYGDKACVLFTDRITCYGIGDPKTIALPAGVRALQIMTTDPLTSLDARAYILSEEGKAYTIPQGKNRDEWSTEGIVNIEALDSYRGLTKLPKVGVMGIMMNGEIATRLPNQPWVPLTAFQGMKFRKLMGPMFWSPSLKTL